MIFYSDINRQDPLVDEKIYDLEAVYQSLDTLLKTERGERLFLPEYGVSLDRFIFEPMTFETRTALYEEIVRAVDKWEPRVVVHHGLSGIEEDPINHTVNITLVFSIKGKKFDQYVYQSTLTNTQKERYYEL